MRHLSIASAALLVMLSATSAMGGTISLGSTATITTVDGSLDFEGVPLPQNTLLTNQFAASGITFAGNSPTTGMRFSSCGTSWGNGFSNFSNNYGNIYGPNCSVNSTDDSVSILFANTVEEVSMAWASNNYTGNGATTISALLNGVSQASLVLAAGAGSNINVFMNFSGMIFDEIRIDEETFGDWAAVDNIQFNLAASTGLPGPGAIALLGFGLIGLGWRRRAA